MAFQSESDAVIGELGSKVNILRERVKRRAEELDRIASEVFPVFKPIPDSKLGNHTIFSTVSSFRTNRRSFSVGFVSCTTGLPWRFGKRPEKPFFGVTFDLVAPIEAEKIIMLQNIIEEYNIARLGLKKFIFNPGFVLFNRPLTIPKHLEPSKNDPLATKLWHQVIETRHSFLSEAREFIDEEKISAVVGISSTPPNWRLFSLLRHSTSDTAPSISELARTLELYCEELGIPQFSLARHLIKSVTRMLDFLVPDSMVQEQFYHKWGIRGTIASFAQLSSPCRYLEILSNDYSLDETVGMLNSISRLSLTGRDLICIEIAKNLSTQPTKFLNNMLDSVVAGFHQESLKEGDSKKCQTRLS